jgi:hypothetical protein
MTIALMGYTLTPHHGYGLQVAQLSILPNL